MFILAQDRYKFVLCKIFIISTLPEITTIQYHNYLINADHIFSIFSYKICPTSKIQTLELTYSTVFWIKRIFSVLISHILQLLVFTVVPTK